MGRPKKTKEAPKPCKRKVTKYRVMKERQWRDFDTQERARQHLIECLQVGAVTFCSIESVEVEEKGC